LQREPCSESRLLAGAYLTLSYTDVKFASP
jgi:hypothetical protein